MTGAAMRQKMSVSANSPTTVEPMSLAHRLFSPVRRLMSTSVQELSSWPTR